MQPKLIIEQKITAFVNRYNIYAAHTDGSRGDLLAFAQQKRLAFKEKVTFYSDEQKTQVVCTFRAEKVLDVYGNYFVEDANGQCIGSFKKEFKQSLLNSTWKVNDASQHLAFTIKESNMFLAVLRRFGGFIPIIGGIIDLLLPLFRYHFVFMDAAINQPVGTYQKTTLFRDHYTLSMADDAYHMLDWRTLVAMGVALDALQSR